jgi:hypothetical protein
MSEFILVTKFESKGAKLKAGTLNAHGGKLLEAAVDSFRNARTALWRLSCLHNNQEQRGRN